MEATGFPHHPESHGDPQCENFSIFPSSGAITGVLAPTSALQGLAAAPILPESLGAADHCLLLFLLNG